MKNKPLKIDFPVLDFFIFSKREIFFIVFIVFSALLLRIWGIWNVSTTDEYNEVLEALRVCSGHFNYERWAKRTYLYILALEYGIYYTIGWLFSTFASPIDFATRIVRNMDPLFIIARATSAFFGTVTVAILFLTAKRFLNFRSACLASIFLCFTVYHIDLSQQAKVDALLGFLVTIALFYILKIAYTSAPENKIPFALSGLFIGLAIQTKLNSIALFIPFSLALYFFYCDFNFSFLFKNFAYFFLFFIIGFIIGNPPVLIAPLKFVSSVLGMGKVYTYPVNQVTSEFIGFLAYPLHFIQAFGHPFSILMAICLFLTFLYPDRLVLICWAFILPFYLLMGASRFMIAPYYMIPLYPFLYLLLSRSIDRTTSYFQAKMKTSVSAGSIAIAVVIGILFFPAFVTTFIHERSLLEPNTRVLAKTWIENNIAPGSRILMDSGKSINSTAPLIAENRNSLQRTINSAKANIESGRIVHGMVDSNAIIYYELLLKTVPPISYDITSTMFGLDVKSIDYYIQNQFEYFIISGSMLNARKTPAFRSRNHTVSSFYESIATDPRLKLLKVVKPTIFGQGDTFYIFKLPSI